MKVAALVKQIPAVESLKLDRDGRLIRSGMALEMNAYCRRAVALAIMLSRSSAGHCTVLTLAPESGEDVIREALAAGADDGVLISDPAFAGSDTLATARALAAALRKTGPADVIVCGLNSVDADTGQVGPQLAQLLDMAFVANVTNVVQLEDGRLQVQSRRDNGSMVVRVKLPAVLSVAERSVNPIRVDALAKQAVAQQRIRRLCASDLGPGPWGQAGSPTQVGAIRRADVKRRRHVLRGPLQQQTSDAARLMVAYGAFAAGAGENAAGLADDVYRRGSQMLIAAILEPGRGQLSRELCTAAALLAERMGATTVGFGLDGMEKWPVGSWGVDHAMVLAGVQAEEDIAAAITRWAVDNEPRLIIAPGTLWGREIAARVAASLNAGLIGDAVELELDGGRLIAWKPALGGRQLAEITSSSAVQMVTLRPGAVRPCRPRANAARLTIVNVPKRRRLCMVDRAYDDDADVLFSAPIIVGVGTGVPQEEYRHLAPLIELFDAPLACTRKVADRGWLPRSRQVGLTGHHVAPRLYVAIGLRGGFNHTIGIRRSHLVCAINSDAGAPVFDDADIGIVGDWRDAVPLLVQELVSRNVPALIRKHHHVRCGEPSCARA